MQSTNTEAESRKMFWKLHGNYLLSWPLTPAVGELPAPGAAGLQRLAGSFPSVCTQLKVEGRTWPKYGETFPPAHKTQLPGRKLHNSC